MSELVSTRDPKAETRSYTDVLLEGLAPDGGLYVPSELPTIDTHQLERWRTLPYAELAAEVKGLFVGDSIPPVDVQTMTHEAYRPAKFPSAKDGVITPVDKIAPHLYVQQLSLGPTAAFKDMALQPLGQEMQFELSRRNEHLAILGATSGDTGSAAEAALKGLGRVTLFMLSPEDGMSEFQKAQMGALSGDNIHNISVRGRFDDCQDLVKVIKEDPELRDIGAVNSINWGRISSQVAYYIAGYLQIAGPRLDRPVDFVVPSGNFGNMLAGHIARRMGVPIRNLVAATNENDVLHRLIQTGEYKAKPAEVTSSPSMDISKASNYERLAYELLGRDPARLVQYMKEFSETGQVRFENHGLSPQTLREAGFDSGTSTHQDRLDSIRWTYQESGQTIDPHTADAVSVARRRFREVPTICLSTALPVKFEATIYEALGFVPYREARFIRLEEQAAGDFIVIDPDPSVLKTIITSALNT